VNAREVGWANDSHRTLDALLGTEVPDLTCPVLSVTDRVGHRPPPLDLLPDGPT